MRSKNNDLSRITIDIPKIDHKRLKATAAALGISMRDLVIESIEDRLREISDYNQDTQKAIKDTNSRKGLVKADNLEDLFKKLGI